MSDLVRLTFERTCASRKLGTAIAASMAIMATTIRSSIKVKPGGVTLLQNEENITINSFSIIYKARKTGFASRKL
jgi:hypothetical protein